MQGLQSKSNRLTTPASSTPARPLAGSKSTTPKTVGKIRPADRSAAKNLPINRCQNGVRAAVTSSFRADSSPIRGGSKVVRTSTGGDGTLDRRLFLALGYEPPLHTPGRRPPSRPADPHQRHPTAPRTKPTSTPPCVQLEVCAPQPVSTSRPT